MDWKKEVEKALREIEQFEAIKEQDIVSFKEQFLSKGGLVGKLSSLIREVPREEKADLGKALNKIKTKAQEKYEALKQKLEEEKNRFKCPKDISLPSSDTLKVSIHPITQTLNSIIDIFKKLNFTIAEGPEIEDDWHNFTALNIPEDHPARDMQDTFYIQINPPILLRTHTSPVQIRTMEMFTPPIRIIAPGRVYRNETVSARSHVQFHQVEGLVVGESISIIDLKATLDWFAKQFFGPETKTRYRVSFFPFTEPSFEMDVSCTLCNGQGCNVCKYTGWLEILGCGMVDPAVLENCNIDPNQYSGFAFGIGIERLAMLKFGIKDIRLFFWNDFAFLNSF